MLAHDTYLKLLDTLSHTKRDFQSTDCIAGVLDYTYLDEDRPHEQWEQFITDATNCHVAALCVKPLHLPFIQQQTFTKRATVLNFPSGQEKLPVLLSCLEKLIDMQVIDELDYVMPYTTFLSGERKKAYEDCKAIQALCEHGKITLKIILETGAHKSTQSIYDAATLAMDAGANFIKTSTGKIEIGATLLAAYAMLQAIVDKQFNCGIKYSGGIKTIDEASQYLAISAAFGIKPTPDKLRIGASSLLHHLKANSHSVTNNSAY